jgi:hypothetical protein
MRPCPCKGNESHECPACGAVVGVDDYLRQNCRGDINDCWDEPLVSLVLIDKRTGEQV